jgi:sigma-B regulation protein RsbU (phosphoserine phosphatase)
MTWYRLFTISGAAAASRHRSEIGAVMSLAASLAEFDLELGSSSLSDEVAAGLHEGVLIVEESGSIIWCNDTACRLLRVARSQLAGPESLPRTWRAHRLDGQPVPREQHPAMRALALGVAVENSVLGLVAGDRQMVWLLVKSTPTTLNGKLVAVTVFTDITDEVDERRRSAATMGEITRALRQPIWPNNRGLYFAPRYRSVGPSREIGGDFYGAQQLRPNRFGFYIGDACGHGAQAAGVAALARHTLRTAGALLEDPSEVLAHLHDVMQVEQPDTYLTAIYGYIDTGEHITVRFSSGGHPLPLLVGCGATRTLGEAGPIIGMVPNTDRPVTVVDVEDGEQLVLHTDGLTSTRTREIEASELLAQLPKRMLTDFLADLLVSAGNQLGDGEADDDASVLVIGFHRSVD